MTEWFVDWERSVSRLNEWSTGWTTDFHVYLPTEWVTGRLTRSSDGASLTLYRHSLGSGHIQSRRGAHLNRIWPDIPKQSKRAYFKVPLLALRHGIIYGPVLQPGPEPASFQIQVRHANTDVTCLIIIKNDILFSTSPHRQVLNSSI
jgi:hypothetical protein